MESTKSTGIDEEQYRREVLSLSSEEEEIEQQQRLEAQAKELGLKIPEIEIVASLAASIASGMVDLSSPTLSSSSSTGRHSMYETTHNSPALEQLATSLSEYTLSSNPPVIGGSTRSVGSLSTRPTSYCSSESRLAQRTDSAAIRPSGTNSSFLSVISGSDKKKERRRSGIKHAIDKIPFRKRRRTPSSVLLPPAAQITVTKDAEGVEKVYVESNPNDTGRSVSSENEEEKLKLEVPVFDHEALLRSLGNSELKQLRETQTSERNLHVSFQNNLISELRRAQRPKIDEKLAQNRQLEDEKREKNMTDAARMEERQLVVEMEQMREFERAKTNSRTRIKYMEGYLSSSSPPDSRSPSFSGSDLTTPSRSYTQQHKAQLAQEYHDYESMSELHAAKIKVLRDRQEIRLQEAIARMDRELDTMIEKHAAEITELQKEHQKEEATTLEALNAKKTKLRHKWVLEEAILRKKLEAKDGNPYGPLPPLSFTDSQSDTRDSAICVSDPDNETEAEASAQHQKNT
ncbi:hypothetical protein BDW74DRAFT_127522 [Aspergillus multicolor]|uniref:uncharacterized protein n=1 Tax=Aspergillus multicolor TaxID=41759 RepID=UPI003CCCB9C9